MSFDPRRIDKYIPIKIALSEGNYIIISDKTIDNDQLLQYLAQANIENMMIIFFQINFLQINISNLQINIPILFNLCNFCKTVKFTSCGFLYPIFFHSVTFSKSAKFKLSQFYNGVSFVNSVFKEETSFERVKFLPTNIKFIKKDILNLTVYFTELFYLRNKVDFLGVKFFKDISFVSANLGCSFLFSNYCEERTIFYKEVDFSCIVEEVELLFHNLNFQNDKFSKEIEISLDSFHRMFFTDVIFFEEVNFENRLFQKKTSFANSSFYKAPKFHNASLHQDTDFRGTSFIDTYSEGAEHAYRTLKLIMNKKRARREEMMFFALEQRSVLNTPIASYNNKYINNIRIFIDRLITKPVLNTNYKLENSKKNLYSKGFYVSLTEKIISFIYLILSNYGQTIKRPFLILLTNVLIIFPFCYRIFSADSAIINNQLKNAYHLSFQHLFKPFEIYNIKFSSQFDQLPFVIYFLSTVESLINIGLFALFILAIRGKFKMY